MSKKNILICIMLLFLVSSGCRSSTEFGECTGFMDKDNPNLRYDLSIRNVVIGGLFFSTIFVPVIVAAKQYKCPVGDAANE